MTDGEERHFRYSISWDYIDNLDSLMKALTSPPDRRHDATRAALMRLTRELVIDRHGKEAHLPDGAGAPRLVNTSPTKS